MPSQSTVTCFTSICLQWCACSQSNGDSGTARRSRRTNAAAVGHKPAAGLLVPADCFADTPFEMNAGITCHRSAPLQRSRRKSNVSIGDVNSECSALPLRPVYCLLRLLLGHTKHPLADCGHVPTSPFALLCMRSRSWTVRI